LNDNGLALDYSAPSPFTTIRQYVMNGFGKINGITSGVRDALGSNTILALIDNAALASPYTNWPAGSGNTIDSTTIIGKYTWFGDANLDGKVGLSDYLVLDTNAGKRNLPLTTSWACGDMDGDGVVGTSDHSILDAARGYG